jgi:BolA protein
MTSAERITIMRTRLQEKFLPTQLDIIDDSDKHRGHAGSRDGAGHYTVQIAAAHFAGLTRIAAHREIFTVLDDLIPREIHALQITIL